MFCYKWSCLIVAELSIEHRNSTRKLCSSRLLVGNLSVMTDTWPKDMLTFTADQCEEAMSRLKPFSWWLTHDQKICWPSQLINVRKQCVACVVRMLTLLKFIQMYLRSIGKRIIHTYINNRSFQMEFITLFEGDLRWERNQRYPYICVWICA